MRVQFIDPGAFRTELSLQRAALVPDGAGGHTESWSEIATPNTGRSLVRP